LEYTIEETPFEYPKKYHFTMQIMTGQEQEAPTLTIREDKTEPDDTLFKITLDAIPNTNREWSDTEPKLLDLDLGGLRKKKTLRLSFPKPEGVWQIQDMKFIPLNADSEEEYSPKWFVKWYEELKGKVINGLLPPLGDVQTISPLIEKVQEAVNNESKARNRRELIDAQKAIDEALLACAQGAVPLLEDFDKHVEKLSLTEKELLQCIVLAAATPLRLADYCLGGEQKAQKLTKLLKEDTEFLKDVLLWGGPKLNLYGEFLDLHDEIKAKQKKGKALFPRLALACALEFCNPFLEMDTEKNVDPLQRYLHYEKAYVEGELDPYIEAFTPWELRYVVNSNAPTDQLAWFHDMLKVYRPEDVYERSYFRINPHAVPGGHPDYTDCPVTAYMRIMSRGGLCGPRAWFGRFSVQAFGTPSRGAHVPGHASYDHWTPGGTWTCKFVNGIWDDRRGYDWYNEVAIRKALGDEANFRRADLLHWMSVIAGEKPTDTYPDVESPWFTLSILQRKRLATDHPEPRKEEPESLEVPSKILEMQKREVPETEEISVQGDGSIVIPSYARTSDDKVGWMKSYLGGMQMWLAKDGWTVEYTIPADKVPDQKTYKMTMRIAAAHDRDLAPVQVTIDSKEYSIPVVYTKGLWEESEPIEVDLGGSDVIIAMTRTMPCHPISVKDFKLTPT
jgi:hypothetical protein